MSRIGKKAVIIPEGVSVTCENNLVTCKGPKGTLTHQFKSEVNFELKNNEIIVSISENPTKFANAYHGTARALLHNMVEGVSKCFRKALEIKGTGYRASINANKLTILIGYSNPVVVEIPEGVTAEMPTQTDIVLVGANKEQIGQLAAEIRNIRKPEPYHGKGIRYKGEKVRHKEGKTAK